MTGFQRPASQRTLAAKRESLTVAGINSLKLCVEPSVHVGRVGEEHHLHRVGAAGFCHCSIRFFSTHSSWEDTQSITQPLTHFSGIKPLFLWGLLFSIDAHVVFGAVLNVFLARLKQEELFESHLHYFSSRDLDNERGSVGIKIKPFLQPIQISVIL